MTDEGEGWRGEGRQAGRESEMESNGGIGRERGGE